MYVTLHLAAGQTIGQLITEVAALAGGVSPRSTSGRMGVLVDAELAHRYLAARYAPQASTPAVEPAPVREVAPVAARPPAKKTVAKKAAPQPPAIPKGE